MGMQYESGRSMIRSLSCGTRKGVLADWIELENADGRRRLRISRANTTDLFDRRVNRRERLLHRAQHLRHGRRVALLDNAEELRELAAQPLERVAIRGGRLDRAATRRSAASSARDVSY